MILLFIHFLLMLPSYVVFCVWPLLCNVVVIILSSFAIILLRKRELVTLIVFYLLCGYICSVSLPHVAMEWSVNVAFPGHTHCDFDREHFPLMTEVVSSIKNNKTTLYFCY